jgi:hypothetical protein
MSDHSHTPLWIIISIQFILIIVITILFTIVWEKRVVKNVNDTVNGQLNEYSKNTNDYISKITEENVKYINEELKKVYDALGR